ncbi:hypothetical protein [Halarcobacter bivalviorum]|uniref:hypothetical protein n=1 Tax=Halarcobacter bivalviorum TaxID=663364 RepID=UPI00100BB932|nr:hypothetical protein [Halarcobacter bivalviorum]RXK08016.1 hypothetical protein CRU97_01335 [Halarcobacter bivalviorum]
MTKAEINLIYAGEIFMYSLWIQNQMADLIIFKNNPELIGEFLDSPDNVPNNIQSIRISYWEKMFKTVMNEFLDLYKEDLREEDIIILKEIYHIRNSIAHTNVSLGRDYMLYKPSGGEKKEMEIKKDLGLISSENDSSAFILKLDFTNKDNRMSIFDKIKYLDEKCFSRLCNSIGLTHSRIR